MADKPINLKFPPLMRGDLAYEDWKKELDIWQDFTDLKKEQQGGALFLTLTGKARQVVLDGVSRDDMKSDAGMTKITDCLDKLYLKDKTQCGYAAYRCTGLLLIKMCKSS